MKALENMTTEDAISLMAAACEAEDAQTSVIESDMSDKDLLDYARKLSDESREKMTAILEGMAGKNEVDVSDESEEISEEKEV